jgi:hypothetical protein
VYLAIVLFSLVLNGAHLVYLAINISPYSDTCTQFGGKLVSFTSSRGAGVPKTVTISGVVTETDFLRRSCDLEGSLAQKKYTDFCELKVYESSDDYEKSMWNFLKVGCTEGERMGRVERRE